jgi:hypothetical protein
MHLPYASAPFWAKFLRRLASEFASVCGPVRVGVRAVCAGVRKRFARRRFEDLGGRSALRGKLARCVAS